MAAGGGVWRLGQGGFMSEFIPAPRAVAGLPPAALAAWMLLSLVPTASAAGEAAAVASDAPAGAGCAPIGDLRYICGLSDPEDLVRVGATRWLVASGTAKAGGMHLIDTQARAALPLHIAQPEGKAATPAAGAGAGAANAFGDCPGPLDSAQARMHGLAIRPGMGAGRYRLYAVRHGGREAIEAFDLDARGARPTATWLGCVLMPMGLAANSVAAFDDGMLLATVLILPGRTVGDSLAGRNTGEVLQWHPGAAGFTPMPGTELPSNNGIEAAGSGDEFYVVSSGLKRIYAYDRKDTARPLRFVQFAGFTPDNVHASAEGPLFSAGMNDDEPGCGGQPKADEQGAVNLLACARGFMVASVDPASMKLLHTVRAGPHLPFMGASSAMPAGRAVYVGGFHSDRLTIHPWP
jgi:hypothetical protein